MVIIIRQLTIPEINKLASRKNVRKIAVENFLMTMVIMHLKPSSMLYMMQDHITGIAHTIQAIKTGISLAKKPLKE